MATDNNNILTPQEVEEYRKFKEYQQAFQAAPPLMGSPERPKEPENIRIAKTEENYITKRLAAMEVYKKLTVVKILCIGGVIALFITVVATIFQKFAGAVAVLGFSAMFMYYLWMTNREMLYLQNTYNFDNKTTQKRTF